LAFDAYYHALLHFIADDFASFGFALRPFGDGSAGMSRCCR
jgi:hypothetical protein